jgi:hypothetical protein
MLPDQYREQSWTYNRVISEYIRICGGELFDLELESYAEELADILSYIDADDYRLAVVKLANFLNGSNIRRDFGELENARVSATQIQLALARLIDLEEFVDTFGLPRF